MALTPIFPWSPVVTPATSSPTAPQAGAMLHVRAVNNGWIVHVGGGDGNLPTRTLVAKSATELARIIVSETVLCKLQNSA